MPTEYRFEDLDLREEPAHAAGGVDPVTFRTCDTCTYDCGATRVLYGCVLY